MTGLLTERHAKDMKTTTNHDRTTTAPGRNGGRLNISEYTTTTDRFVTFTVSNELGDVAAVALTIDDARHIARSLAAFVKAGA